MKKLFASAVILGAALTMAAQQQQQSPFVPPAATPRPPAPGTPAGQTTTPADQGVATNPTGNADLGTFPAPGNIGGQPGLGQATTNGQQGGAVGTSPLFLTVTPTPVVDASGQPIGTLQQLSLSPSGTVNFGVINMGGRLVPVPWQLIVTGTTSGRGGLSVNVNQGVLNTAPPVAMGQLPLLAQEEIQERIFGHFAGALPPRPTVVTSGSAQGGTGRGPGVTITGGSTNATAFGTTNTVMFNTNANVNATNAAQFQNNTLSNQAVNTTGGLLSPTGRTNAAQDHFNSGPRGTDRFGPRPTTAPPTQQPTTQPPNTTGQPTGPGQR